MRSTWPWYSYLNPSYAAFTTLSSSSYKRTVNQILRSTRGSKNIVGILNAFKNKGLNHGSRVTCTMTLIVGTDFFGLGHWTYCLDLKRFTSRNYTTKERVKLTAFLLWQSHRYWWWNFCDLIAYLFRKLHQFHEILSNITGQCTALLLIQIKKQSIPNQNIWTPLESEIKISS